MNQPVTRDGGEQADQLARRLQIVLAECRADEEIGEDRLANVDRIHLSPQGGLGELHADDVLNLLGVGGVEFERRRLVARADPPHEFNKRAVGRHVSCP